MNEENSRPLLSVCLITYNHAPYIAMAIESVLMQRTTFDFNLIIADDFSTDGTREIILDFKEKFPDRIELILQERNVGPAQNWFDLITAPHSKYIAYFEADDYWIDQNKLEKQVGFLEENSDYAFSFHNTLDLHNGVFTPKYTDLDQQDFTISDFIGFHFARTTSIVFRRPQEKIPNWFLKVKIGDWPLSIYLLQNGKARYLNETMAVYRIHGLGTWNGSDSYTNSIRIFQTFEVLREVLRDEFKALIEEKLYYLSLNYVICSFKVKNFPESINGLRWFIKSPFIFKIRKLQLMLLKK